VAQDLLTTMAFAKHRTKPFAVLLAALLIVVVQTKLFGRAFIAPPILASRPARRSASTGSAQEGADGCGMGSAIPVAGLLAIAAATSKCQAKRSTAPVAVAITAPLTGASLTVEVDEPKVIMRGSKGRRWRLGLAGKTCMLTGMSKQRGYYRTYVGKKIRRFWRPHVKWRKVWWEEEKKWVSLYISVKALRRCDEDGLQACATKAGIDLYAWVKPHWEAGSRQPLSAKVGRTGAATRDRRLWPQYEKLLNAGRPMADLMPGPHAREAPMPWTWRRTKLNPGTHIFEPKTGVSTKQPFDKQRPRGKSFERLKVLLPGMIDFKATSTRGG